LYPENDLPELLNDLISKYLDLFAQIKTIPKKFQSKPLIFSEYAENYIKENEIQLVKKQQFEEKAISVSQGKVYIMSNVSFGTAILEIHGIIQDATSSPKNWTTSTGYATQDILMKSLLPRTNKEIQKVTDDTIARANTITTHVREDSIIAVADLRGMCTRKYCLCVCTPMLHFFVEVETDLSLI
jgi:hypothetical protein